MYKYKVSGVDNGVVPNVGVVVDGFIESETKLEGPLFTLAEDTSLTDSSVTGVQAPQPNAVTDGGPVTPVAPAPPAPAQNQNNGEQS